LVHTSRLVNLCRFPFDVRLRALPDVGIVMQVRAEYLFAILGVLHRVEDVRMPELIHVPAHDDVLGVLRVFHQHRQVGPVGLLDSLGILAGPAFPRLLIHDSESDRVEVKCLYRRDSLVNASVFGSRVHGLLQSG
jgi:hypothetical protein